ncbi:Alg9-like mannosyltransferase family-domain-containing protein [Spinellus fusiger]|nr:Alg9-like mannosyltransferase family-domain-containing protein [Spinellus fusiger]
MAVVMSTFTLFMVERTACFVLSLVIDFSVIRLYTAMKKDYSMPLLVLATSQVMLVYYTRPFSNSVEAVVLCLSLCAYVTFSVNASLLAAFTLGSLLCLGVFTRITFVLYGFPLGVAFLWSASKSVVGLGCSFADSVYYGALQMTVDNQPLVSMSQWMDLLLNPSFLLSMKMKGNLLLTPLNNMLYNVNIDNLELHGLHPRYLHLLVNFPMLFGPLAIASVFSVVDHVTVAYKDAFSRVYYVALLTVATSMAGLSIFPHQEARFLAPMLVSLIILYTWNRTRLPVMFWITWIMFNIITTFVFGVLHQGGLVPTLSYLQQQYTGIQGCEQTPVGGLTCHLDFKAKKPRSDYNVTTHFVFYKTYMPPRHLLAYPTLWKDTILNLRGGVPLNQYHRHRNIIDFVPSDEINTFERTLLIAPELADLPVLEGRRYYLLTRYNPHINFDHIDLLMKRTSEESSEPANLMTLNVWLIGRLIFIC